MKKELFSFSKLTTFKTCPLSYYYTYVKKGPREDNIYSFLGKEIHSCLEDLQQGLISKENAIDRFEMAVADADMLGFEFPTENSKNNFVECMILYFKNYKAFTDITDFGIEEYFEIDVSGVTMRGYIDIYTIEDDKYIDVYDYKSSSKFSKKDLEEKKIQLILYGIALKNKYPDKEVRSLNFDMCKYSKNKRGTLVERNKADSQEVRGFVSIPFTEENIELATNFVKNIYDSINKNDTENILDWEANKNPFFCKNLCSNFEICRVNEVE